MHGEGSTLVCKVVFVARADFSDPNVFSRWKQQGIEATAEEAEETSIQWEYRTRVVGERRQKEKGLLVQFVQRTLGFVKVLDVDLWNLSRDTNEHRLPHFVSRCLGMKCHDQQQEGRENGKWKGKQRKFFSRNISSVGWWWTHGRSPGIIEGHDEKGWWR